MKSQTNPWQDKNEKAPFCSGIRRMHLTNGDFLLHFMLTVIVQEL